MIFTNQIQVPSECKHKLKKSASYIWTKEWTMLWWLKRLRWADPYSSAHPHNVAAIFSVEAILVSIKLKLKKSLYRTYFKAFIWKLVQAKINLLFLDKVDTDFQQVREIKASTCSTALFSTFKHSSWTSQDVNNQQHFPVFSQ